jgi:hypothetical protein
MLRKLKGGELFKWQIVMGYVLRKSYELEFLMVFSDRWGKILCPINDGVKGDERTKLYLKQKSLRKQIAF